MDKFFSINNSKGQSDTVFEVLIAVILLGFVLVSATFAMSSLSNTKCSKSIDISLQKLSQTLEKSATNTLLTTDYLFDLPYCFGSDANVSLVRKDNSPICTTYCPGSNGECYLLMYYNKRDKVNPVRYKCVNISPIVEINKDGGCDAQVTEKYSPLKYTTSNAKYSNTGLQFKNGRYKFTSGSFITNSNSAPLFCVYKKVKE